MLPAEVRHVSIMVFRLEQMHRLLTPLETRHQPVLLLSVFEARLGRDCP